MMKHSNIFHVSIVCQKWKIFLKNFKDGRQKQEEDLEGCNLELTLERIEGMVGAQHIFTSIEIFIFAFHGFELLNLSICILFGL